MSEIIQNKLMNDISIKISALLIASIFGSTLALAQEKTDLPKTSEPSSKVIRCADDKDNVECKKAMSMVAKPNQKNRTRAQQKTITQRDQETAVSPRFTKQNLVMYSGEAVVLEVGEIDRVAIGNGKVASTTVLDKNRLLIIAQDVGDTNILLWDKKNLIREVNLRITAQNLSRLLGETRNLLDSIPGLTVNNVGDRIFIEGKDLNEQDLGKVKALSAQYPGIVNRTTGKFTENRSADPSAMVMFDLYFVEFKKSYLQNLGVSWQKSFNGFNIGVYGEAARGPLLIRPAGDDITTINGLPPTRVNGLSASANIVASLPGTINLAVDSGDAILLASPKITSRSGSKAKFTAGGEIPLPSTSDKGTNVEFKPYGILLEVEPQVNGDGSISGLVRAEVSSIDPAITVLGIPAFLTRRTEADFFSQSGEAVVLSGLYSQELSKNTDKVPFLGDVPLLNSLFSNNAEARKNSELVVFIVPHLYSAKSEMNQRILKNTRNIIEEQNTKLNGDGKDLLPKLKTSSQLWSTDLLGNEKLGRDPSYVRPPPPITPKIEEKNTLNHEGN